MNMCIDYKELGKWGSGRVSRLVKMFYETEKSCKLVTNELGFDDVDQIANQLSIECINPELKMIELIEHNGKEIVHKLVFD